MAKGPEDGRNQRGLHKVVGQGKKGLTLGKSLKIETRKRTSIIQIIKATSWMKSLRNNFFKWFSLSPGGKMQCYGSLIYKVEPCLEVMYSNLFILQRGILRPRETKMTDLRSHSKLVAELQTEPRFPDSLVLGSSSLHHTGSSFLACSGHKNCFSHFTAEQTEA